MEDSIKQLILRTLRRARADVERDHAAALERKHTDATRGYALALSRLDMAIREVTAL